MKRKIEFKDPDFLDKVLSAERAAHAETARKLEEYKPRALRSESRLDAISQALGGHSEESDLRALESTRAELAKAEAKIAAVRRVTAWSTCPAEPEADDDGPLYQGFVTDQGGTWVKVEDLVEALRG